MKRVRIGFIVVAMALILGVIPTQAIFPAPVPSLDRGMISLTFDDGYKSLYTLAAPLMSLYGLPGTAYIITDYVGYGYAVTWDQLWKLRWTNGWEIANHTMNHPDLLNLSDAAIIEQIRGARAALELHGLINVTSLAFPYGDYDQHILDLLKSDGTLYSSRRAWWEDTPYNAVSNFDQWQLIVIGMDEPTAPMTFATVKPYIDAAIANKTWLILMFHDLVSGTPGDYQSKVSEFTKICQYLNSKRGSLDTVRVSDGVAKMLQFKSRPVVLKMNSLSAADPGSSAPPPNILIGR